MVPRPPPCTPLARNDLRSAIQAAWRIAMGLNSYHDAIALRLLDLHVSEAPDDIITKESIRVQHLLHVMFLRLMLPTKGSA